MKLRFQENLISKILSYSLQTAYSYKDYTLQEVFYTTYIIHWNLGKNKKINFFLIIRIYGAKKIFLKCYNL